MLRTSLVLSCAALLSAAAPLHAAVLSVDFGPANPLQPGFVNWETPGDIQEPITKVFTDLDLEFTLNGSITGKIASGVDPFDMEANREKLNTRVRDGFTHATESFTLTGLLKDRVVSQGSGATAGLFIQLEGLKPNTEFSIQVWGADFTAAGVAKGGNFSLFDRTGGLSNLLGSYSITAGALPEDNDSFSVTGTIFSDANGKLVVQTRSNIDGTGIANGFVLTAVPEPSSAILLGMSCGLLGFARRRRG